MELTQTEQDIVTQARLLWQTLELMKPLDSNSQEYDDLQAEAQIIYGDIELLILP